MRDEVVEDEVGAGSALDAAIAVAGVDAAASPG